MEALIRVTDAAHLPAIDGVVHDQWFWISDVVFDEARDVLRVPFERTAKRGRIRGCFGAPEPPSRWVLEVRGVRTYRIEDTEKVGRYDFNELDYVSSAQVLAITTGIPLGFDVSVTGLDVTVRRDPLDVRPLSEFQVEAEEEVLTRLEDLGVKSGLRGLGGGEEPYLELGFEGLRVWFYSDGEGSIKGRGLNLMFERWDYQSPKELSEAMVAAVVDSFR